MSDIITVDQLVQREIVCCLSHLVSTLAGGYGLPGMPGDLADLMAQAGELALPVEDWEEAARDAGWHVTEAEDGYWYAKDCHGDPDAEGDYNTAEDAARAVCEEHNVEPYQWEVYEHWAVSPWLAEQLIAQGERVDTDFAGMNVWARICTGQGIASDGVMVRIHAVLTGGETLAMARVPSYPYRVIVTRRLAGNAQQFEQHNYESLPGAWAYRDTALRRQSTKRVEVLMVLDESTPGHTS